MTYPLYRVLMWLLVPAALIRLLVRGRKQRAYRKHIAERFGFYSPDSAPVDVWIHAVSVGETRAAEPLIRSLIARSPGIRILLTNMTPTGRETARTLFGDRLGNCYLPYDLTAAVDRFLEHFRPTVGIIMETELWPTLLARCHRARIPVHLVNARLSSRSAVRYQRFPGLSRKMIGMLTSICAQTNADAERLGVLGNAPIHVTGNIKFDRTASSDQIALGEKLRNMFGNKRRIFLVASTREGEEELILRLISRLDDPAILTVIVPRHPQRFDDVSDLLRRRGIAFQRRSDNELVAAETTVVVGDSMGEMFAYYAACDVAFIGGSLLPFGGQNLLEACCVGKPVIVGPHTFNFDEATEQAIFAGAAIRVKDAAELISTAATLLDNPERSREIGNAGLRFMAAHRGATDRTLEAIGL